jgi:hypothetical protein
MVMILIIIGLLVAAYMLMEAARRHWEEYWSHRQASMHDPDDVAAVDGVPSGGSRYDHGGLR